MVWSQAEGYLLQNSVDAILPGLKALVAYMASQLEADLELLSDKGRDRMFIAASGILEKLSVLLTLCESPSAADAQARPWLLTKFTSWTHYCLMYI